MIIVARIGAHFRDAEQWPFVQAKRYPLQKDEGSCGVFVCWATEYLERCYASSFSQNEVSSLRKRLELFLNGFGKHSVVLENSIENRATRTDEDNDAFEETSSF